MNVSEKYHSIWNFEIQIDHQIRPWRSDWGVINKMKTRRIVKFAIPSDYRVKIKENEKSAEYLDLARGQRIIMKHESNDDSNYSSCVWNRPQILAIGLEELEIEGNGKTI